MSVLKKWLSEMDIYEIRRAISYDPNTGEMTWNQKVGIGKEAKRWNARYAGKRALGCRSNTGHLTGTINKKHFKAHRVAWAIVHGYWPDFEIDHINGNPSDNRICNLREATRTQNAQNVPKRKGGLSKYRGVSRDRNKWRALIHANGVPTYLGSFDTEEKAAIAYDLVAPIMHGEFARTNIVRRCDDIIAFIDDWARKNHRRTGSVDGLDVRKEKGAF